MSYRLTMPGQEKELSRSFVREIAEDVWMVEGYVSSIFLLKPASSNTFILRDGDTVLVVDPGLYPFYRGRILELVEKFRRGGAKRVVLTVTQGHFDHVGNNDVLLETGFADRRFVLAEPELPTIDLLEDFMRDLDDLAELYDVYSMLSGRVTSVVKTASRVSPRLARAIFKAHFKALFAGLGTMKDRVEVLPLDGKEKRVFGSVELEGWALGRFFLVHDGSHSPGHISIYDGKTGFLMSGDVTVEINPAFYYSSLDRCIETAGKYRAMAEEGFIELASDSHRSPTFLPSLYERWSMEPISDIQLVDVARGGRQCAEFFGFFEEYFSQLKQTVLEVHRGLGEATIPQIVEGLGSAHNPAIDFKKAMVFEKIPSRMDVLVATVLRETDAPRVPGGNGAVFSPVEVES